MAELAFKRREVKAERIYFIPAGSTVDGDTVTAEDPWPDADPLENYKDFEIADIETLTPERETESETFDIPSNTDGYTRETDEWVTSRTWTAETAKTNALVIMLEEGLTALPVAGTAQVPGARKENFVEGIMLQETGTRGLGVTRRRQIWARLFLVTPGNSGPQTSKVQIRFQQMDNPQNTFVMVG